MADITMSLDDTLELDTIIEESTEALNSVTVADGTEGSDFRSDGLQTKTYIFDPINSGIYNLNINNQTLTVKVINSTTIPDTVVDNFEWGGPFTERYSVISGSSGNWTIDKTDPVISDNYSLKMDGSIAFNGTNQIITSDQGDGLKYYPKVGDEIWFQFYLINSDSSLELGVFLSDGEPVKDGLAFETNARDNDYRLFINRSEVLSGSKSWESGKWYLLRYDSNNNNGDLEIRTRVYDGSTINNQLLVNETYIDTNSSLIGQRGISYGETTDKQKVAINKVLADKDGGLPDL